MALKWSCDAKIWRQMNLKLKLNIIVRKGKFYAFLRNFDIVATLLLNPIILIFLLILITIV